MGKVASLGGAASRGGTARGHSAKKAANPLDTFFSRLKTGMESMKNGDASSTRRANAQGVRSDNDSKQVGAAKAAAKTAPLEARAQAGTHPVLSAKALVAGEPKAEPEEESASVARKKPVSRDTKSDASLEAAAETASRSVLRNVAVDARAVPRAADQGEASASKVQDAGQKKDAKVSVIDMRLSARRSPAKAAGPESERAAAESDAAAKPARPDEATHVDPARAALGGASADSGSGAPDASRAPDAQPSTPASFAENLAARLQDGAADIVRSAQIVLKDGDAGLIRLRLEPDHLGGVKIELKIAEKQISGKIVVESDIAGDAFRSSLDALKDAFAEGGFEATALEVEVRGRSGGEAAGDGRGGRDGEPEGPYWSRSLRELEAAVPLAAAGSGSGAGAGALNMIV